MGCESGREVPRADPRPRCLHVQEIAMRLAVQIQQVHSKIAGEESDDTTAVHRCTRTQEQAADLRNVVLLAAYAGFSIKLYPRGQRSFIHFWPGQRCWQHLLESASNHVRGDSFISGLGSDAGSDILGSCSAVSRAAIIRMRLTRVPVQAGKQGSTC